MILKSVLGTLVLLMVSSTALAQLEPWTDYEVSGRVRTTRADSGVVCIAGPSSAGKTTFIKRLKTQLQVNGIHPVPISLDNYYVDRAQTPRDDDGKLDFESIERGITDKTTILILNDLQNPNGAELSPEQRDAFLLHQESGLTLEEIGRIAGVGRETIKSRLRYAMKLLRRGLEGCDDAT